MSAEHLSPETLGGLADAELSSQSQAEAQSHLRDCHGCALRLLEAYQLKNATKQAARSYVPSSAAMERLTAHAQQKPAKRLRLVPAQFVTGGAIAALFFLVVFLGGVRQSTERATLGAELLDMHLASLSDSSSPQVVSTDRHTVKPWFQGKLPFSFNLPEPQALPAETTLQGADLAYLEGKPAALLLFSIHKHRASVFLTQAGQLPRPGLHTTRSGFNISRTRAGGLDMAAVSDVNRSDLDALVSVLAGCQ